MTYEEVSVGQLVVLQNGGRIAIVLEKGDAVIRISLKNKWTGPGHQAVLPRMVRPLEQKDIEPLLNELTWQ
jgi:hypothetical protein